MSTSWTFHDPACCVATATWPCDRNAIHGVPSSATAIETPAAAPAATFVAASPKTRTSVPSFSFTGESCVANNPLGVLHATWWMPLPSTAMATVDCPS